jgi:hypothetical protein
MPQRNNKWFQVDGSNRGFITELKIKLGEEIEYDKDDKILKI